LKEGDGIGRILMIEFGEQDSPAFDEVMDVLKRHPDFDCQQLNEDSVLSIPGLEIYPNCRKTYRGRKEISLTARSAAAGRRSTPQDAAGRGREA